MPPEHERRNMGRIGVQASHKLWLARLLVGTSALSLMGAAQDAMAQESADDTVVDGDAIVVTGIRARLAASADIHSNAQGVLATNSAEDRDKYPDPNPPDTLMSIPGRHTTHNGNSSGWD